MCLEIFAKPQLEPPNLAATVEFWALAEYQPKKIRQSRIASVTLAAEKIIIRLCGFIFSCIQQNFTKNTWKRLYDVHT